jgi:exopolysaccharide biosynthesis polyprenyl glycosylphosphotransferase
MIKGTLRRNWRAFYALVAMGVDGGILVLSFLVAAFVEQGHPVLLSLLQSHGNLLFFSFVVFLAFFLVFGVYRTISYSSIRRQAFKAGKGYVAGIPVILSSLFLAQNAFYSRFFLFLFLSAIPLVYVVVWSITRLVVNRLQRKGYGRWNTLAIGSAPTLQHLVRRLEDFPELGYDLVATLRIPLARKSEKPLQVKRSTVERIVRQNGVGLIVFSTPNLNGTFEALESLCKEKKISMRIVSKESDDLFTKARLHDIASIPLYLPRRWRVEFVKKAVKRLMDIAGAVTALVLFSPVFAVVALATKLESPGPVFFRQKRSLADADAPFDCFKFRSMYLEADEQKESLYGVNETSGALFKMRNDPRVTRVGRLIRKFSIDELPQLINVLNGDMSLVGPRPLPVGDFKRMAEEDHMGGYYRHRSNAKPGMTGLWQISGRSELGFREMVLLDLYYIENQTILFDIEILAETIPVVIFGRGAY